MLCTVVGAGPGLGVAIAERFLTGGFDVALIARTPDRLETWHQERDDRDRIGLFVADAGVPTQLERAFVSIQEWRGETRVLIYNASVMSPDSVSDLDSARLEETMAVNVGGALTSVSCVLPAMRRAHQGTILLTGGGLGLEPYPEWGSLAAGKAALRNLGISLYKELLPQGIHAAVIAVCGIVSPDGPFDSSIVAEQYWRLHQQPLSQAQRELIYLPEGADPYYNDPDAHHRSTSYPITPK